MPNETPIAAPARKLRLSSADRKEILPWQRAESMTRCSLYWMPVSGFPAPAAEKAWLLQFTTRLGARLKSEFKAEPWVFLQYNTALTVHDDFVRRSREFMPLMGISRRPGAELPNMPSKEDLQAALDEKRMLDVKQYTEDYAYWFMVKSEKQQRELFQGLGGLTLFYKKPDPKTAPPELAIPARYRDHELFKSMDVHALLAGACSMQDEFLKKSKEVFGAGMKNVQAEFVPFILPLLSSADFFRMTEEDTKAHFDLFDIYLRESTADQGMVLASKHDLDEILAQILEEMREETQAAAGKAAQG